MSFLLNLRILWRKTWIKICTFLCLLTLLCFLLLPIALKKGVQYWLVQNGAEKATIEKSSFNPFTGRLHFEDIAVEKKNKSVLKDSKFELNFGFLPLLTKTITIDRASYSNLTIDVEQLKNGRWRITSYTTRQPENKETQTAPSGWNVHIKELVITHCTVHLTTPRAQTTWKIESASLQNFTTAAKSSPGTFHLKGTIDNSPVQIALNRIALQPSLDISGHIQMKPLDIKRWAGLVKTVFPRFAGQIGMDGQLLITRSPDSPLNTAFEGKLELQQGHLGNTSFDIQGKTLSWDGKLQFTQQKNVNTVLSNGTLRGEHFQFALPEAAMKLTTKAFKVGGATQGTLGQQSSVTSKTDIDFTALSLELPQLKVNQGVLRWQGELGWQKQAQQTISGKGTLLSTNFSIDHPTVKAHNEKLSYQGAVSCALIHKQPPTITLGGTVSAHKFMAQLPAQDLQYDQQDLKLTLDGTLAADAPLKAQGKSKVTAAHMQLSQMATQQLLLNITELSTDAIADTQGQITVPQFLLTDVRFRPTPQARLFVHIPEVLASKIHKSPQVIAAEHFTIKQLNATEEDSNTSLASLQSLTVTAPNISTDHGIHAKQITADALVLLPKENGHASMSLQHLNLQQPSWTSVQGSHGKEVTLDDLVLHVTRNKDGKLEVQQQLAALFPQPQTPSAAEAAPSTEKTSTGAEAVQSSAKNPASLFTLDKLNVSGKSTFWFTDLSTPIPFTSQTEIKTLQLTDISSLNPHKPAHLNLQATMERRAPLAIQAESYPFEKTPHLLGTLHLKNYPLSQLSPYTVQSVGLKLASGQLNLASDFTVAKGNVDIQNKLFFKKLETQTIGKELAAKLDQRLPLPLDSAIAFLQDSEDNLKLDIPIKGPVAKLDVGIADILITALGKAIVPAASSYLVYTLGPYGALAYVGMKVGETMMHTSLPPLKFAAGNVELSSNSKDYLKRLGTMLKERPNMDLTFCPVTPAWEFLTKEQRTQAPNLEGLLDANDRKRLLELGQQRAQAVIDHLQKTYAIDQDRLMICETKISGKRKAEPLVNVQL